VIMATSWAFRDIWEDLNTTLNLLLVDEFADWGMDDAGAEAALAILSKMGGQHGRNVFLISHKENLISRVGQILLVHKEAGFSRFEANAEL
jgi:ABC-type branched-subunit amino acid transport system ATPase component